MASEDNDDQTAPPRGAAHVPGTDGESATQFGQRMEASEDQAEQYSDVEDSDPESGTAAQKQAGTAIIADMLAASERLVDGDPDQ